MSETSAMYVSDVDDGLPFLSFWLLLYRCGGSIIRERET